MLLCCAHPLPGDQYQYMYQGCLRRLHLQCLMINLDPGWVLTIQAVEGRHPLCLELAQAHPEAPVDQVTGRLLHLLEVEVRGRH